MSSSTKLIFKIGLAIISIPLIIFLFKSLFYKPKSLQENLVSIKTQFIQAMKEGKRDVAQKLLEKAFEESSQEVNPLEEAVILGDTNKVAELIKSGSNVYYKNPSGVTLLHRAADFGRGDIAELLIKAGLDVDAKTTGKFFGTTPIDRASSTGNKNIVEILIKYGADVNTKDWYGLTPILDAAQGNYGDIVDLLIKNKANVNDKDSTSNTPLYWAVVNNNKLLAKLLIERGANVNETTRDGKTALHYSKSLGYNDIETILKKAGAKDY